jgi:hypothetical protein
VRTSGADGREKCSGARDVDNLVWVFLCVRFSLGLEVAREGGVTLVVLVRGIPVLVPKCKGAVAVVAHPVEGTRIEALSATADALAAPRGI